MLFVFKFGGFYTRIVPNEKKVNFLPLFYAKIDNFAVINEIDEINLNEKDTTIHFHTIHLCHICFV